MLPRLLCENLCSLNPGVDRLAFTIYFKMYSNGQLHEDEPRFLKTIIRSKHKLAY